MAKLAVRYEFVDKFNHAIRYTPGMVIEIDDARAKDLSDRGFGKILEEEKPEPKKKTVKKSTK